MSHTAHPDWLFPPELQVREVARRLYATIRELPFEASANVDPAIFVSGNPAGNSWLDSPAIRRLNILRTPLEDILVFETLRQQGHSGKIAPVYVADCVVDPETPGFVNHLDAFGALTGCDAYTWKGYLEAHRIRRELFKLYGAKVTMLHPPTARAETMGTPEMMTLFRKVCIGKSTPAEAETFRAAMLCEFARMSAEDGLALHVNAGTGRAAEITTEAGTLAHVPLWVEYAQAARLILQAFGDAAFEIVFVSGDEAAIACELVPMAASLPAVKLGLSESASGDPGRVKRFCELTAQVLAAGKALAPMASGNDLPTLMATSDRNRRVLCAWLAGEVAVHSMSEDEALGVLKEIS